jgi:5-methylcytosine-specific restriction enzyme B
VNFQQRQKQFKKSVREHPNIAGFRTHFADAFGVSNTAKIIGDALFAFNANFQNFDEANEQAVVHCFIRLPPHDELYFAIAIKSDIAAFKAALIAMRSAGASASGSGEEEGEAETEVAASPAAPLTYTDNNKNVKGYLAEDGRLYLRNKGFWNSLPEHRTGVHSVSIDGVYFAHWPAAASAQRGISSREFVGYLGDFAGIAKVHELHPWPDESVDPLMRRMPHTLSLDDIENAVAAAGGHYPNGEVQRIHASLNFHPDKHFAILSGLSGTGKTQLALLYANAIHGITARSKSSPFQFICPVRPDWTDPTGLTGYPDVLTGRYAVPPFLEAMLLAAAHRDSPVFVILDEMNLAPVEHYLADVLSAIETGKPLRLHANSVPIEGSNGASVPPTLAIPSNLYVVGTINVDETTHSVSDKVLDRAMLIDMSSVDMPGFIEVLKRDASLEPSCREIGPLIARVHEVLDKHGLAFGYRLAKEVIQYHAFCARAGGSMTQVTDDLMAQKVLVKLRGGDRERPLLDQLLVDLKGMPRAEALLNGLLSDLNQFSSFRASR